MLLSYFSTSELVDIIFDYIRYYIEYTIIQSVAIFLPTLSFILFLMKHPEILALECKNCKLLCINS